DDPCRSLTLAARLVRRIAARCRAASVSERAQSQGTTPVCLLAQPERPHERNFCSASDCLASDRPRPQIGNRSRSVRIRRVELRQFLFRFFFDLLSDYAKFLCELRSMTGNVFEQHFQNQAGNGIQITGKSITTDAERFQRNRAAP